MRSSAACSGVRALKTGTRGLFRSGVLGLGKDEGPEAIRCVGLRPTDIGGVVVDDAEIVGVGAVVAARGRGTERPADIDVRSILLVEVVCVP